jgi:hypothetical protein
LWLVAVLGLAAYVGLVYALTLVPVQFEVPLPGWAIAAIPPVAYGLLVWLWVRRPSIVRWLVGTAVLSGLHMLLAMSREPLTALLDPALAGRPLPWLLPPPLPEVLGLMFLLVPLRDVLHAPARHARERGAGVGRPSPSPRVRPAAPPREKPAAPSESGSLSEALLPRSQPAPEPVVATTPPPPPPPAEPTPIEEPRRRRAARVEGRRQAAPIRPPRRSDVVLRIALDRIMGQLPPGTFLAPEDEVAASLSDPGYLRISGELVVTQLAEGVARVSWADIADQFPPHLVGLSTAEISTHLGEGLRLPLDEVISQLPHELFVADTSEIEITPGFDRIPLPFHPVQESESVPRPVPEPKPAAQPEPQIERLPAVEPELAARVGATAPPAPVEPTTPAAVEPPPLPELAPIEIPPAAVSPNEPTVRVSFDRIASQIPTDAFRVPLEQVSERMRQPGVLLLARSLVLPQLADGLIRVSWNAVASQFPRGDLAESDAGMTARLPNGIRLPLDEIIRQIPPDLFMIASPAADVRGLESFPAPFQPLLSDPAPELPPATSPAVDDDVSTAVPVAPDPVVPDQPEPVPTAEGVEENREIVVPSPPLAEESVMVVDEPEVIAPTPSPAGGPGDEASHPEAPPWADTAPIEAPPPRPVPAPPAPILTPPAGSPAETAEARRIVALLAPIASFDVSVQAIEGVTVFAMASPTVAQETAVAVAGLALPLLMDRRAPWGVDQITLRGPETALVLTPLGGPHERRPVLAAAAPRGGALALLEILCRQAGGNRTRCSVVQAPDPARALSRSLAPAPVPSRMTGLIPNLNAFGNVTASVLRDAESEAVLYFFLPAGDDVPAVGAFAQDLQAVMRKAAGSGAVFRTAILRSGDTLLVIQPEEIGHGRSIVIVAGGSVTRPGLAYRQVERAAATLMSA